MEIERKFLVKWWPGEAGMPWRIVQTYVYDRPVTMGMQHAVMRLREVSSTRVGEVKYFFTAKLSTRSSTLSREEVEFEIDVAQYEHMLSGPFAGNPIVKTRFSWEDDDTELFFTIDWFEEDLAGLWLAEIEFKTEEQAVAFDPAEYEWLGEEVTDDERYLNSNLAASQEIPTLTPL